MNFVNLLNVKDIRSQSTPLNSEVSILVMIDGEEITVPRPVMLGLANFIHVAYGAASAKSLLDYDSYRFEILERVEYDQFITLQPFYKYLTDAGLSRMSKVYIRDYSQIEHFYRRKQERVPVEIDGFQTRLIMKPHNFELMECGLDIEQRQLRPDLMRGYNHSLTEVRGLATRPGDENWWSKQHAAH